MLHFILHDYPVVGSTNDEAKTLLAQGAGEGTIVCAQRQTAGRGRRGRQWMSPEGNLYLSLILTPRCLLSQASQLSFVIAVAVGQAILPFLTSPHLLSYKWPNDILVEKKKVAGILIETESQGGQLADACVVGIGLNLALVPPNMPYPVTALGDHSSSAVLKEMIFPALLDHLKEAYQLWTDKGFAPIREQWLQRAHGLGQTLAITVGNREYRGEFMDLSPEGALLLKNEEGTIQRLMSAEIL